jgi:hypothetical protein
MRQGNRLRVAAVAAALRETRRGAKEIAALKITPSRNPDAQTPMPYNTL